MGEDLEEQQPGHVRDPMGTLARIATAVGMLGIAWGTVLSLIQLDDLLGIFRVPDYSPWMLGALGLGGLGVVLAVVDLLRRGNARHAGVAFITGMCALASSFVIGIVILMIIVVVVFWMISNS